ncbi:MAG: glycosyltransferase [Flavobacteriales bacterium]|nr:glycosyltransferase [Flavobacteriales bacterium]
MKILVLLSRIPYPLDKGDKLRAYHQIKNLSKNHKIYLIALNESKAHPDAYENLKKYCSHIKFIKLSRFRIYLNIFLCFFQNKPFQIAYFYSKKVQKQINGVIDDFKPDHIYCQLIRMAEYAKHSDIPKTLDYMDALSKGIKRRIETSELYLRWILKMEGKRVMRYEHHIFKHFDFKTIISEQDQNLIIHPINHSISIISNGIDSDFFVPEEIKIEYDILFAGNMQYPPNVEGATYIAKQILPIVQEKYPNIKFLIAGANPARSIQNLASENITVTGWVEDIRDCYSSSLIFLAPMQIGTGLQNKLLEAMSMKLPCITSSLVNNALGAKVNHSILIGDTPQDYANHIIDLLENKEKRNFLKQNAYSYVRENFNWEVTTDKLEQLICEETASKS